MDVYLDSIEQKVKWAENADEADTSLSKFVQACVEYAIDQGGPDLMDAGEKAEQLQEYEDRIAELEQRIDEKDIVIEKLQTELKQYRTAAFREDEF